MAQLVKTFYPFDPLPAQDLNDIVAFLNTVAAGTGIEDNAITTRTIEDTGWLPCTGTGNYTAGTVLSCKVVAGLLSFRGLLARNSGNIPSSIKK